MGSPRRLSLLVALAAVALCAVAPAAGAAGRAPVAVPGHGIEPGGASPPGEEVISSVPPVDPLGAAAEPEVEEEEEEKKEKGGAISSSASGDVFDQLGGSSPFCDSSGLGSIGASAQRDCEASGSIAQGHPTDNYAIDNNVGVGLTKPTSWIASTLQWLITLIWHGLLYALKGVLAMLDWSFTTDLYDASRHESANALAKIYRLLGAPWLSAALAITGLVGIWNGLVRRRAIETIGGLAATVALILVAVLIVFRPEATVGHFSDMSNEAALGALSAASAGSIQAPAHNLAKAEEGLFDAAILRPWCALQFGDIGYCTANHDGTSVADVWLSFPPGSDQRNALFKATNGAGGEVTNGRVKSAETEVNGGKPPPSWVIAKSPQHVELQGSGGTVRRFAILFVVGVGVAGAVALFGSLAVGLLIDGALMALLLLLLAPVMMLAPAFGAPGRRAFGAWLRKLASAIFAKFFFSAVLAIVITISSILAGLEGSLGGWLPTWIVQGTFWWALFLRRQELLAMVSIGTGRPSNALSQIYYAGRTAHTAVGLTRALTTRPARALWRPLRRNLHAHRAAEERLIQDHAGEYAGQRAREVGSYGHRLDHDAAEGTMRTAARDRARLGQVRHELADVDRRRTRGGSKEEMAALRARQTALSDERDRLEMSVNSPEVARARAVVSRGGEAPLMNEREVRQWAQQRRVEVDQGAWNDPANLRAAGINPQAHARAISRASVDGAAADEVARDWENANAQMRRDRAILGAYDNGDRLMSRRERRARRRLVEAEIGQRPSNRQTDALARAERRRIRRERERARVYR